MPAPPPPRLAFLLSAANRRLQRWIEGETAGGLSSAQAGVLFFLGRHDGALIGEVAGALDAAPSAMSGLIDRMARAGLVERRADAADRRAQRIWLTDRGREARKVASAGLETINARLTDGFSAGEVEIIGRWLSHIQQRFPEGDSR